MGRSFFELSTPRFAHAGKETVLEGELNRLFLLAAETQTYKIVVENVKAQEKKMQPQM